ncbi:MAG: hypothetical protein QXK37_03470 [Candidatus Woesearchaeota archaeon]
MEMLELIKGFLMGLLKEGEREMKISFYKFKRQFFMFALELVFAIIGILFIVIGGILVLRNYFPIEWVLLISGLIILNVVMLTARFK